ncbi:MAG: COR domain-containing protein [Verrucomicrobiota bacterium]
MKKSDHRYHMHPGGEREWPEKSLPAIEQLVVRGGEITFTDAIVQVMNARPPERIAQFKADIQEGATPAVLQKYQEEIQAAQKRVGKQPLALSIPPDPWEQFPNLRRLYLWDVQLEGEGLPAFPPALTVLECVGVEGMTTLPALPAGLRSLVVQQTEVSWAQGGGEGLGRLEELVLQDLNTLHNEWVQAALAASAKTLGMLDLSRCARLGRIEVWPTVLEDLRLNGCEGLRALPGSWPASLRRLELRGVRALAGFADFPPEGKLDFLDVGGMRALTQLPAMPTRWPRTLKIYDSGVELPPELHGVGPDSNVAREVRGYLEALKLGEEVQDEVKLILLGNGRCGKSSLARVLTGEGEFDPEESSTHGIHLWEYTESFVPQGETEEVPVRVKVWDFAGQDLYHSTHRLFLQSKAVFLLCETLAGDGADEAGDERAAQQQAQQGFREVRRSMAYWQEQVDSLGRAPGRRTRAERTVVQTKVNRKPRLDAPVAVIGLDHRVSAETGEGIEDLRQDIRSMISHALGRKGERTWPLSAIRVKEALEARKEAGIRIITREEFDEEVRKHAAENGLHAEDPGLVLTLLHRSGALFASEKMPDRVILDQRWAVQGIYTLFDREKECWAQLIGNEGKFRLRDLRAWSWEEAGYEESEQETFLSMMMACDIAFELLPPWLTDHGEAVYVAPAALPEREWWEEVVEGTVSQAARGEEIRLPRVAEESLRSLLVKLGTLWGRTATIWRDGALIKAFYPVGETKPSVPEVGGTWVRIQWNRVEKDAYYGELVLAPYGADSDFVRKVQALCEEYVTPEEEVGAMPAEEASPAQAEEESALAYHPSMTERNRPEIALSFAGCPRATDLEEAIPRRMRMTLEAIGYSVEDYRMEQDRHEGEKHLRPRSYLDYLSSQDFIIVFLTKKYLFSPWCCYEAMRLYQRLVDGAYHHGMMRVFSFPEVAIGKADDEGEVALAKEMEAAWEAQVNQFNAAYADLEFTEAKRRAERSDLGPWYDFAALPGNREALSAALLAEWFPKPLPEGMPTDEDFTEWAESIRVSKEDPRAMYEYAKKAWTDGSDADRVTWAIGAYREGRRREGRDLAEPDPDPVLEAIRRKTVAEGDLFRLRDDD